MIDNSVNQFVHLVTAETTIINIYSSWQLYKALHQVLPKTQSSECSSLYQECFKLLDDANNKVKSPKRQIKVPVIEIKKVPSHFGKGMQKSLNLESWSLRKWGSRQGKLCIEQHYRMDACDWASLFPPGTNYVTLDQQAHLEITATNLWNGKIIMILITSKLFTRKMAR